MVSVIMASVIMVSVIMVNVMAPPQQQPYHGQFLLNQS
jgi:hypothetical protein